ncbi:flagellar export protein FliJ [Anopheles sinensis]|uniref:Flagellar export protein FliJ n=1 Tax=Anopheles sinensis TaxID=74873 RepID=A0A084VEM2_ANOSI|nr:flagellar export protein FliJ [Anopheles sinensis]
MISSNLPPRLRSIASGEGCHREGGGKGASCRRNVHFLIDVTFGRHCWRTFQRAAPAQFSRSSVTWLIDFRSRTRDVSIIGQKQRYARRLVGKACCARQCAWFRLVPRLKSTPSLVQASITTCAPFYNVRTDRHRPARASKSGPTDGSIGGREFN